MSGEKHASNLSIAAAMRSREGWKYRALKEHFSGRRVEFEFGLAGYVFDLAFLDEMLLVEFDGPDHLYPEQACVDAKKTAAATACGYAVVRRQVRSGEEIPVEAVRDL